MGQYSCWDPVVSWFMTQQQEQALLQTTLKGSRSPAGLYNVFIVHGTTCTHLAKISSAGLVLQAFFNIKKSAHAKADCLFGFLHIILQNSMGQDQINSCTDKNSKILISLSRNFRFKSHMQQENNDTKCEWASLTLGTTAMQVPAATED